MGPILIVEDDRKTSALLTLYFEREGFATVAAHDGFEAIDLSRRHNPLCTILDIMLPKLDGWEVCRELRRLSTVPIVILSARGDPNERIMGLTLGADDYVVKPFSPGEVVARMKAILRRSHPEPPPAPLRLAHGALVFDTGKRRVLLDGAPVSLTPFEYKLLHALMAAPGRVFLREELLDRLYPNGETVTDRVIDVHIGNLRQKIERDLSKPIHVLTARGMGYQFAGECDPV